MGAGNSRIAELVRRAACRHEWARVGSDYLTRGTVWRCQRCGYEKVWPAPSGRMDAEGWCEQCGRPVTRAESCCPGHPAARILQEKPMRRGRVVLSRDRDRKGAQRHGR